MSSRFLVVCFTALLLKSVVNGKIISGVAPLNPGTFDKVLPRFPAVLVKFENSYAYGDKQKELQKLADLCKSQPDLLLAEVNTRDTTENSEIAERFGIKKEDYPALRLFLQSKDEPIVYTGEFTSADIAKFAIRETGLWLDVAPCLPDLDRLVQEFWAAPSSDQRQVIIKKAEAWAQEEENAEQADVADIYVRTMRKIIEKGEDFVHGELERVENLIGGKVSKKKKQQLQDRTNILTSFNFHKRDEL